MDRIDSNSLGGIGPSPTGGAAGSATGADADVAFAEVLRREAASQDGVRFSKHARERLDRRDIQLTPTHLTRLHNAVARAQARGARESLVLMDDLALIVSIRNRTVITATTAPSRQENVFTNIDSAVIA